MSIAGAVKRIPCRGPSQRRPWRNDDTQGVQAVRFAASGLAAQRKTAGREICLAPAAGCKLYKKTAELTVSYFRIFFSSASTSLT
jgi:hypothetical protein